MHCIKMTANELRKSEVLNLITKGKLKRQEAAALLGITARQVDRLQNRLQTEGIAGLAHRSRGRPSNRALKREFKLKIARLVKEQYLECGPTFVAEKLLQNHDLKISREALRLMMQEEGLWKGKRRKEARYHPRRLRRQHFGELLQGDGSHHDWFEGRRDRCVLIAVIDDATNRAFGRFFEGETIEAYVEVMRRYIEKYGMPRSFYVDKDSIFRVNKKAVIKTEGETQFGRMMKELGIQLICAHSPQAKGRVERLFGTLQDRLVKEMRLLGIDNLKEANNYLEREFWGEFNKRWNCEPAEPGDLHLKAPPNKVLDKILTLREQRKISRSLDFSYKGTLYQLQTKDPHRLVKKPITIFEKFDGSFWVEADGKPITIIPFKQAATVTRIEDTKTLNVFLNKKRKLTAIERFRRGIRQPC